MRQCELKADSPAASPFWGYTYSKVMELAARCSGSTRRQGARNLRRNMSAEYNRK
jgi:hypothetical protein